MSESGPSKAKQKHNGSSENKDDGKKTVKQTPRKRVSQACDVCRTRKDRCDGERPACSTCVQNGRECSYNANVKKRGLPEGYVRGMEKLWGLAVREVQDVEEDVLAALGDENQQRSIWSDENSENLVDVWRKSHIFTGLEALLSSMTIDVNESVKRKRVAPSTVVARKHGPREIDAAMTPQSLEDSRMNDLMDGILETRPSGIGSPNMSSYQSASILAPIKENAKSSSSNVDVALLPELPSETWHLLDVYFSYTHSWLPIVERHDLLRVSYQYSEHRTRTTPTHSADHALLWAVIAYAKFQHRAINNIPRALGSVGEMVWTAERMYVQARSLIPNEETTLELGHIQALLILTLANMGLGHIDRSWFLIGQAVRGIALIHSNDAAKDQLIPPSKSRTKHVFLGCFVLDTIVAARIRLQPHLRSSDLVPVGLLEEDGLEEWDPWMDCLNVRKITASSARMPAAILSTFNNLVRLVEVLNDAICAKTPNHTSLSLVNRLLDWTRRQSQPQQWDVDDAGSISGVPLLPHHLQLHAIYANTLSISRLRSSNAVTSLEQAVKSARHITDVLNHYSKTYGLLIVPPTFEYYIKSIYEILDSAKDITKEFRFKLDDFKKDIDYCLEVVEPAWPAFETLRATQSTQLSTSMTSVDDGQHFPTNAMTVSPRVDDLFQNAQSYSTGSILSPQNDQVCQSTQPGAYATPLSRQTNSLPYASIHGRPQNPLSIYENAHATFGAPRTISPRNSTSQDGLSLAVAQALGTAGDMHNDARLRGSMSMGSDTDASGEPVFSDLMRLDATEWSGNWDQSLVNLGFTDQDNMNQAFYTFCQEPDPLQSSNVFQQLMANSNAEAANYFDTATFGAMTPGMGIPMTGFEGFGFNDESEGIEAGQILQALAASDQSHSSRMT